MSFLHLYLRATLIYTPAACVDFTCVCTLIFSTHHDNPCNMWYTGYISNFPRSLLNNVQASAEQMQSSRCFIAASVFQQGYHTAKLPFCAPQLSACSVTAPGAYLQLHLQVKTKLPYFIPILSLHMYSQSNQHCYLQRYICFRGCEAGENGNLILSPSSCIRAVFQVFLVLTVCFVSCAIFCSAPSQ